MSKSKDTRNLALSLFKGLDVLTALAARQEGCRIQDLVESLGLPRSSLLRLLDSLAHYGLVRRDEGRRYQVTEDFRQWRRSDPDRALKERFGPLMRRITAEVGEMTVLGRLEGRRIRHIHYEEPDRRVRVTPPVGRRFSIETMAMGKLALAVRPDLLPEESGRALRKEIEEAGRLGWAMNRGESEEGIVAWGTWLGEPSPLTLMLAVTWPDFRFSEVSWERARGVVNRLKGEHGMV